VYVDVRVMVRGAPPVSVLVTVRERSRDSVTVVLIVLIYVARTQVVLDVEVCQTDHVCV
jgi:hypothetical protein